MKTFNLILFIYSRSKLILLHFSAQKSTKPEMESISSLNCSSLPSNSINHFIHSQIENQCRSTLNYLYTIAQILNCGNPQNTFQKCKAFNHYSHNLKTI
jgi:hypothetical protein